MTPIMVPISAAELFDKISILRIKSERITDAAKLMNVRTELALLEAIADRVESRDKAALQALEAELKHVNELIWDAENIVRTYDCEGRFDADFIRTARSTYENNDRRAAIKRKINNLLNSPLVEEKSHKRVEL